MISRVAGRRPQLSSRWLAPMVAIAYLLISSMVGIAVLVTPKQPGAVATPAVSIPTNAREQGARDVSKTLPKPSDDSGVRSGAGTSTSRRTPTPTSSDPAPAGFERVSGPAGIRTVIPNGWLSMRSTGPGSVQATDPADGGRYVKYGGSPAPVLGLEPSHIEYENGFAARSVGYRRIVLSSAAFGDHDAVVWEFEHHDGTRLLHVRSLYWRAAGTEYFVLAAAPAAKWSAMLPVYDTMVANGAP